MDEKILKDEILNFVKDAESIEIMGFKGYKYCNTTPIHQFVCVDLFVEDLGFLHIVARNSFSEDILKQLLQAFIRVKIKKFKRDILYVYSAYEFIDFDCIGIVPPDIAEIYKESVPNLTQYGYWIFPMYGIEFLHKFTKDQFWTQIRRQDKWRVSIVNWNRKIIVSENS
ncbi:MAG: hypothetical protein JW866_01090 [Ignavibacteriales bacterium]|nr:hypothetical protein [Ignavibacteriales bacterium]